MLIKKVLKQVFALGLILAAFLVLLQGMSEGSGRRPIKQHTVEFFMSSSTFKTYLADKGTRYPKGSTLVIHLWTHERHNRSAIRDEARITVSKTDKTYVKKGYESEHYLQNFKPLRYAEGDQWSACMEFGSQNSGCPSGPLYDYSDNPPRSVANSDWKLYVN